jgi:hypothetical protein
MFGVEGGQHHGVMIFPFGHEEVKAAASQYPVGPGGGAAADAAPDGLLPDGLRKVTAAG